MLTTPRRSRQDEGQATAELLGWIVLVGLLIAAVLLTSLGSVIADGINEALCRIIDQTCETELSGEPDEPCVRSADSQTYDVEVGVAVFGGGGSTAVVVEELSDGTYRVTRIDGIEGGAGLGVGLGARLDLGDTVVGASATAGIAARLGGEVSRIDIYDDEADATNAAEHAVLETQLGAVPIIGGPLQAGQDLFDRDDPEPVSSETVVSVGVAAEATAEAAVSIGTLAGGPAGDIQVELDAALETASQISVSTGGAVTIVTSGSVDLSAAGAVDVGDIDVDGEDGVHNDVTIALTLGPNGVPTEIVVTQEIHVRPDGSLPLSILPTSGAGESGQTVVSTATIDLGQHPDLIPHAIGVSSGNLLVGAIASQPLLDALGTAGTTVAEQVYDVDVDDYGASLTLIAGGGAVAGTFSAIDLDQAGFLDHGTGTFVPWEACSGS